VPRPSRERAAVLTALVLVQVFFGVHYLAAKRVMAEMSPLVYASLRAAGGAALVLCAALALKRTFPSRGDAGRLALYAILGVVINQICFVEGLYRTTTIHSALLNTAIPVMTLLAAVALRRERMNGLKAISVGLALAGALLILQPSEPWPPPRSCSVSVPPASASWAPPPGAPSGLPRYRGWPGSGSPSSSSSPPPAPIS
jgi:drug/metabolite transporter (DMT)-like permease